MIAKETLHLGQKVLFGNEKKEAVVDALTQLGLGLLFENGYALANYEDVYVAQQG